MFKVQKIHHYQMAHLGTCFCTGWAEKDEGKAVVVETKLTLNCNLPVVMARLCHWAASNALKQVLKQFPSETVWRHRNMDTGLWIVHKSHTNQSSASCHSLHADHLLVFIITKVKCNDGNPSLAFHPGKHSFRRHGGSDCVLFSEQNSCVSFKRSRVFDGAHRGRIWD